MSTQPPNSNTPCIYLSGKITGLPVEATEAKFSEAARLLRAKGYRIINPLRLGIPPNASWESAMAVCLEALKGADILCALSDWKASPGALLEVKTAKALHIVSLRLPTILKYFKDY